MFRLCKLYVCILTKRIIRYNLKKNTKCIDSRRGKNPTILFIFARPKLGDRNLRGRDKGVVLHNQLWFDIVFIYSLL